MKIYDKEKAFNANYSNKLQKMSEETRELIMANMTHEQSIKQHFPAVAAASAAQCVVK